MLVNIRYIQHVVLGPFVRVDFGINVEWHHPLVPWVKILELLFNITFEGWGEVEPLSFIFKFFDVDWIAIISVNPQELLDCIEVSLDPPEKFTEFIFVHVVRIVTVLFSV